MFLLVLGDPSKVALALQCLKRFSRVPFSHLVDSKLQAGLETCCQILSLSQGNQEFTEMSGLVSTYIHVKQSADNEEAQIAVDWKLIEERDRLIQREAELERELVVVRDAIAANSLEISKAETSLTAITEDLRRAATLGHHTNLRERLVTSKRSQCENFWLKFQAMLNNL
ncbi:hypothetical protein Acr_17g0007670 [Actinidia rufa]|uniref:Uncharacterized protein n=1 Tax=Actinidia rufa TaxID=165716 RepID=A0A7J0G331_9ERIC|nr:hypothetical protein Acr_17g0007670 [Actinidia rufa]